ncbi:hypothetical protein ACP4OV_024668 [Aristida adscensionis]
MGRTYDTDVVMANGTVIKTTVTSDGTTVQRFLEEVRCNNSDQNDGRLDVGIDTEWRFVAHLGGHRAHRMAVLQLCVGRRRLVFHVVHADHVPLRVARLPRLPERPLLWRRGRRRRPAALRGLRPGGRQRGGAHQASRGGALPTGARGRRAQTVHSAHVDTDLRRLPRSARGEHAADIAGSRRGPRRTRQAAAAGEARCTRRARPAAAAGEARGGRGATSRSGRGRGRSGRGGRRGCGLPSPTTASSSRGGAAAGVLLLVPRGGRRRGVARGSRGAPPRRRRSEEADVAEADARGDGRQGVRIDKPKHVTVSEWDVEHLSSEQVQYACIDAFVSYDEVGRLLLLAGQCAEGAAAASPAHIST